MRSLRNLIYQASIEAIDNQHVTITEEDFVFASTLTSGDKPILWKNPFDEGVKVTEDMLRSPPKDIGWEDYFQNTNTRGSRKPGNMFD
ncbi:Putative transposition protein (fragment) [Vibrio diabolicus]